jgi:hypothetical protein
VDVDDSGNLDVSDAVYLLNYLFVDGDEPPEPFWFCGEDPTEDDLGCEHFPPCSGGIRLKLVAADHPARILIPRDGSLGLTWTGVEFDDSSWIGGEAAVGYDEGDEYLPHIGTDLGARMNGINTTAYIRIPFTVERRLPAGRLLLWMKYDDGFIAYLNGERVAERNAPVNPAWDSASDGQQSDSAAVAYEEIDISDAASRIGVGKNVLAIHGLNTGITSSDFLIAAEMDVRSP